LLSKLYSSVPLFLARKASNDVKAAGTPSLLLKKVLVLSKMTRYEYEKMKGKGCTEMQLKREVC